MFKWLVLLAVVAYANADSAEHGVTSGSRGTSCKCGWANRNSKRIVGGTFYKANEYPFIAGIARIRKFDEGYAFKAFCGGSIITPNHVITAAHCTDDIIKSRTPIGVLLGSHDRAQVNDDVEIIPVRQINQHPSYDSNTVLHDISILFLDKSINYNTIIGPVCMPKPGLDVTGQTVRILGWGAQAFKTSMTLKPKKLDTNVVSPSTCSAAWRGMVSSNKPTQICTLSKRETACQGDSGGPVVWLDPQTNRYTLVGLVSFGPECTDERPTVHTKVEAYLPWIKAQIDATKPAATCVKV